VGKVYDLRPDRKPPRPFRREYVLHIAYAPGRHRIVDIIIEQLQRLQEIPIVGRSVKIIIERRR
jgi:hypothetical protein